MRDKEPEVQIEIAKRETMIGLRDYVKSLDLGKLRSSREESKQFSEG